MLATLIIGLREGLEAALIVGIIAAFLRKNGTRLTAMWIGVALAVALSIAVGLGLSWIERDLPQAQQEGMESLIGAVAVCFVTGMILWMNTHARDMKRQLETEATAALGATGRYALAGMAFLAVLKEGFETSVFLLATFSAAQSTAWAAAGAVLGLLLAVLIGWGIYAGGVRINLARFFRATGAFLVLVAAGLVVTALRTAHEAGWLNAGQHVLLDLSWLVAPGTVRSALLTGVLGIPADPRLIEVIGWLAYLIPVSLLVFWPAARRPGPTAALRLRLLAAAALAVLAALLAGFYPAAQPALPQATLVAADGPATPLGTAQLSQPADGAAPVLTLTVNGTTTRQPLAAAAQTEATHAGLTTRSWHLQTDERLTGAQDVLTLDAVAALNRGRIPIGLSPAEHPGPFHADWSLRRTLDVHSAAGHLTALAARGTILVTLSGSGLLTPRTLTVRQAASPGLQALGPLAWRTPPAYTEQIGQALRRRAAAHAEWAFWARQLPIALLLGALLLAGQAARRHRRSQRRPPAQGSTAHDNAAQSGTPQDSTTQDRTTQNSRPPQDGPAFSQGTFHAPL